jgi:hypothetical protein
VSQFPARPPHRQIRQGLRSWDGSPGSERQTGPFASVFALWSLTVFAALSMVRPRLPEGLRPSGTILSNVVRCFA